MPGEDVRFKAKGREPFHLYGAERSAESSQGADSDNGGVLELAGDHESCGTGRWFVIPSGQGYAGFFDMLSERAFDESPDEKRDEQDKSQGFNALFRLEEDGIDHGRVLKEREVLLHAMLLFVKGEDLFGVGCPVPFPGYVAEKHETSGFHFHLFERGSLLGKMTGHAIADFDHLSGLVFFGTSSGIGGTRFDLEGQIVVAGRLGRPSLSSGPGIDLTGILGKALLLEALVQDVRFLGQFTDDLLLPSLVVGA